MTPRIRLPLVLTAAAAAIVAASTAHDTQAADHNDPIELEPTPTNSNDPAADIADIFAWNDGTGDDALLNLALTWRADPSYERQFDPTVQFTIHILVDKEATASALTAVGYQARKPKATHAIRIAFGVKDVPARDWRKGKEFGIRVQGVPEHDTIVAPVGQIVEPAATNAGARRKIKLLAGVVDDAFFADKDGFFNGVSTTLGNTKLTPECKARFAEGPSALENPVPGKVPGGSVGDCNNPTSSWPNYPLLAKAPFGLNNKLDGFGLANMHGVVLQIPIELVKDADGQPLGRNGVHKKLHVWATSEGKVGRTKSGQTFRKADWQ